MSGLSALTRRRRRGLSLVETLVAAFMLLGGFIVTARMLHAGLRYSTNINNHLQAVRLGQRRLQEVRAWSRANHRPIGTVPLTDWSSVQGVTMTYPEFPEFHLTTNVPTRAMFTPCSLFEKVYDPINPALKRDFSETLHQLLVTVDWGGPAPVTLTTVIGAPSAVNSGPYTLTVVPAGSTGSGPQSLAHDDIVSYQAELRDGNSNLIPDIYCDWAVAGAGNGILTPQRTGPLATFQNRVVVGSTFKYLDGRSCQLQAAVRYRGVELRALSPLLSL
ncbi:MAG: hypothetical protein KF760_30710 [Candidatus Eremiobacteraeota bacterium]|nr:hypothetical protein [Candidatus Eremiobacteraeota bacterium]MCW5868619.1 hypothetical protein [Candidatus Eremiobacteraeota bacterium]